MSAPLSADRPGLNIEQLYYLKTVLGVGDVLLPRPSALVAAPPLAASPSTAAAVTLPVDVVMLALVPLSSDEFPLNGEKQELVGKMLRAMKLESAQVLTLEWMVSEGVPEQVEQTLLAASVSQIPAVVFGSDEMRERLGPDVQPGVWQGWNGAKVMMTFSPRVLLSRPEKKKDAWAHLQQVMRELALKPAHKV